jgi:hypothetical protein
MASLVAISPDAPVQELVLQPGRNTLGRAPGNSLVLPHPSVSSRHCEIILDGELVVRDLGSTNGTAVDGDRVSEFTLQHAQRVCFGNLEFELRAPELARVVRLGVKRADRQEEPPASGITAADAIAALAENVTEAPSFYSTTAGAFTYPFKLNGVLLLAGGTVFFLILEFMGGFRFFAISGVLTWWVTIFGYGYLFAYVQKIISGTALGEEEMPDYPDLTNWWSDVLHPFLLFSGTLLISFGPGLVVAALLQTSALRGDPTVLSLLAFGAFYLPMALLAVAVSDSFVALSPHIVIPAILRTFVPYLVTFGLLAVLFVVRFGGGLLALAIAGNDMGARAAMAVAIGFGSLYLVTVEARLLGLLFRSYRERLAWL